MHRGIRHSLGSHLKPDWAADYSQVNTSKHIKSRYQVSQCRPVPLLVRLQQRIQTLFGFLFTWPTIYLLQLKKIKIKKQACYITGIHEFKSAHFNPWEENCCGLDDRGCLQRKLAWNAAQIKSLQQKRSKKMCLKASASCEGSASPLLTRRPRRS